MFKIPTNSFRLKERLDSADLVVHQCSIKKAYCVSNPICILLTLFRKKKREIMTQFLSEKNPTRTSNGHIVCLRYLSWIPPENAIRQESSNSSLENRHWTMKEEVVFKINYHKTLTNKQTCLRNLKTTKKTYTTHMLLIII